MTAKQFATGGNPEHEHWAAQANPTVVAHYLQWLLAEARWWAKIGWDFGVPIQVAFGPLPWERAEKQAQFGGGMGTTSKVADANQD